MSDLIYNWTGYSLMTYKVIKETPTRYNVEPVKRVPPQCGRFSLSGRSYVRKNEIDKVDFGGVTYSFDREKCVAQAKLRLEKETERLNKLRELVEQLT